MAAWTLGDIAKYFNMSAGEFAKEWRVLNQEDKDWFKNEFNKLPESDKAK